MLKRSKTVSNLAWRNARQTLSLRVYLVLLVSEDELLSIFWIIRILLMTAHDDFLKVPTLQCLYGSFLLLFPREGSRSFYFPGKLHMVLEIDDKFWVYFISFTCHDAM